MVLVRRDGVSTPLSARYDGPYRVLRRSLRVFELQIGNRTEKVSTLRLKAVNADSNAGVALPPRRGRPPNALPATLPVTPETYKMPGGETTPKQKTVIVQGKPGETTPAQKTQAHPGKKALRPCLKAETRAKTRDKTTPTLGRGRGHHVKNRLDVVPPAFTDPETTPKISRRSGLVKHVTFSLTNGRITTTIIRQGF